MTPKPFARRLLCLALSCLAGWAATPAVAEAEEPPYVGAYFYYWYDVYSGEHLDPAALSTHPNTLTDYSYKSVAWFKRELSLMKQAGIDHALLVYWGRKHPWSLEGIQRAAQAVAELAAEGRPYPQLGCFYDTNVLTNYRNLFRLYYPLAKDMVYKDVEAFYKRIPKRYWSRIQGRPVVWTWVHTIENNYNDKFFSDLANRFQGVFGVRPYIVKEHSWWKAPADAQYRWGAADAGIIGSDLGNAVLDVGPGYDDTKLPDRQGGFSRPRLDGLFFKRNLERVLKLARTHSKRVVIFETWNEWHEASTIAPSTEHGALYVQLASQYITALKQGRASLNALPCEGLLSAAWTPGSQRCAQLLRPKDGKTAPYSVGGKTCLAPVPFNGAYPSHLYFDVADEMIWLNVRDNAVDKAVELRIELYDVGTNEFEIQYDSADLNYHPSAGAYAGAFKPTARVKKTDTKTWKTFRVPIPHALFSNRGTAGSDFRIVAFGNPNICVSSVSVDLR